MYYIILLFLLSFTFQNAYAQKIKTLAKLPKLVDETSGLEESGPNKIWTFNDSGGKPELYLFNKTGKHLKTIKVKGAKNRDWEDITKDDKGNFYIGDIGNNLNKSKALRIYKIPNPNQATNNVVKAELIKFKYEDQHEFPPEKNHLNFDAEALIWFNNHLYIFSKNRTHPFDGKINLYRLPDQPGKYVAEKIGSFDTGGRDNMTDDWITAGDLSPSGKKLALLSSGKVWIFYNFKGDRFLEGSRKLILLPHKTQKEGICFINENQLYISDEEWQGKIGRKLYQLTLKPQ